MSNLTDTKVTAVFLTEAELAAVTGGEMGMYADAGLSSDQANAAYGDTNSIMCADGGTFVGLFGGDWGAGVCYDGLSSYFTRY